MKNINVAILGASGIGKYHAREFHNLGCNVTAILGSSEESALETAAMLRKEFGIDARPYSDLNDLLSKERIDLVSICTPPETHEEYVVSCLNKSLDVLCEKPLVAGTEEIVARTKALTNLAKKKGRILTVNTQMAALLPQSYPPKITQFSVYTEPGTLDSEMLLDHGPHVNSMLIKLVPQGKVSDIVVEKQSREEIILKYKYSSKKQKVSVKYHLRHKADRPRAIKFSINGKEFERQVNAQYEQFLVSENKRENIEDLLKTSIRKFIGAVEGTEELLINEDEVIQNSLLQQKLIEAL